MLLEQLFRREYDLSVTELRTEIRKWSCENVEGSVVAYTCAAPMSPLARSLSFSDLGTSITEVEGGRMERRRETVSSWQPTMRGPGGGGERDRRLRGLDLNIADTAWRLRLGSW